MGMGHSPGKPGGVWVGVQSDVADFFFGLQQNRPGHEFFMPPYLLLYTYSRLLASFGRYIFQAAAGENEKKDSPNKKASSPFQK
jgi:hypothetical protein